jgi:hypothetical protein
MHHDVLLLIGSGPKSRKLLSQPLQDQRLALQQLASHFGPVAHIVMLAPLTAHPTTKTATAAAGLGCLSAVGVAAIVCFAMADAAAGHRARVAFKAFCDTQVLPPQAEASGENDDGGNEFFANGGWQAAWVTENHSAAVLQRLGLKYSDLPSSAAVPAVAAAGVPDASELRCILFYIPSGSAGGPGGGGGGGGTGVCTADDVLAAVSRVPQATAAVAATTIAAGGERVWILCTSVDAALHVSDHVRKQNPQYPRGKLVLTSSYPTQR